MYADHKHSYLHSRTPVNPRIINRAVDLARSNLVIDQYDALVPFNRVVQEQPCTPVKNCDITRRPLGFGRVAMPKLCRELHSKDKDVQLQAVNAVCDIVHDPERNYEAIKLKFPDRMVDLLAHDNPAIRERICIALTTIAGLLDGKFAIVKNVEMMKNLQNILDDPYEEVRYQGIILIERLGMVWMVADSLVENGFIELLINKLKIYNSEDPCVPYYLQTLEHLTYCNGKFIALECGLYNILLDIIDNETNELIVANTLKVLSILTQTDVGKEIAHKVKLLKKLNTLLHDERPIIYENAAGVMLYATIKCEDVLKAMKLPNIFERLLTLAKNHHEPYTQRCCLQILTNLCAQCHVLEEIVVKRYDEINAIYVGHDEHAKRVKYTLLHDMMRF